MPKNPAACSVVSIGSPHFAQAICLTDWRLANDVSPIGSDQHFKFSLDFHLFSAKIKLQLKLYD